MLSDPFPKSAASEFVQCQKTVFQHPQIYGVGTAKLSPRSFVFLGWFRMGPMVKHNTTYVFVGLIHLPNECVCVSLSFRCLSLSLFIITSFQKLSNCLPEYWVVILSQYHEERQLIQTFLRRLVSHVIKLISNGTQLNHQGFQIITRAPMSFLLIIIIFFGQPQRHIESLSPKIWRLFYWPLRGDVIRMPHFHFATNHASENSTTQFSLGRSQDQDSVNENSHESQLAVTKTF